MLSIIELAELMNLEPGPDLFFEAFPIDDVKCVVRFANTEDTTCAYFKIDLS